MSGIQKPILDPGPAKIVEKTFVVVVLLMSTGAFLNLVPGISNTFEAGQSGTQVVWSFVYLLAVGLFWKCRGLVREGLKRETWLVLLIGFAITSTVWSEDPLLTIRRGIALACTT